MDSVAVDTVDLIAEELCSLTHARRHFIPPRNGKPINPSTLWRWIHKGIACPDGSRVRLEIVYAGGAPMTTKAAVSRFFGELTRRRLGAAEPEPKVPAERSPEMRKKLAEYGLV